MPIRIQSMTNTHTSDTLQTINQIIDLVDAGCELVRVTTQNIAEAENLKKIKDGLAKKGIQVPLIADVHFNPKVAEVAALYADKVRINPGNYYSADPGISNIEAIEKNLKPLLDICKANDTAIRIGVNHGSLSKRILENYGDTPKGMVESLMEFVLVCRKFDFHKLILSVKTSNVKVMIETNRLLVRRLSHAGFDYPIHLGVTEAGGDDEGRIKSAAGIGYLLSKGIGNTIRVSLSEDPVNEVPVAMELASNYSRTSKILKCLPEEQEIIVPVSNFTRPLVISRNFSELSDFSIDSGEESGSTVKVSVFKYSKLSYQKLLISASVDIASWFMSNNSDAVMLINDSTSDHENTLLLREILQAIGIRYFRTEYIACPTCGRTNLDLVNMLRDVKKKTSELTGLKIGVMGCRVNGPGEMQGVDYGVVGRGNGTVNLYKHGEIFEKRIPQTEAVSALIDLIKKSGDWTVQ